VVAGCCGTGAGLVVSLVAYVALPVLETAPSIAVPVSCSGRAGAAALPRALVPGTELEGRVISSAAGAEVIFTRYAAAGNFSGGIYIVASRSRVTWEARPSSDMVVAAIRGRYAYIYNNKIGYVVDWQTGKPAGSLVEFDNYRGLYEDNGRLRVQTEATITLVGPGTGIARATVHLSGIVDGCAV